MVKKLFQTLILSTLPIFAYIIADIFFKNSIYSIMIALGIGLAEFIVHWVVYRKLDYFIFVDVVIILLFGFLSILFKDPFYFKIKPAIMETVLLVLFMVLGFSGSYFKKFINRYLKNFTIPDQQLQKMQLFFVVLVPVLVLHIGLIILASLFFSQEMWAFISGGLLYILFGVIFAGFYLSRFLQQKWMLARYKNEEWFDVVDEESRIVGKAPRAVCHNGSKLLHPVVHVHLLNSRRELLLQKRASDKDIQPGLWDTSVGGHISSGESLDLAVKREVLEEAGVDLDLKDLIPLKKYVFESDIEKELVFSFLYLYEGEIHFQESEIDEVQFLAKDEIEKLISQKQTTPNFVQEFQLLLESGVFKSV